MPERFKPGAGNVVANVDLAITTAAAFRAPSRMHSLVDQLSDNGAGVASAHGHELTRSEQLGWLMHKC